MIKREINKAINLSADSVFKVIEQYYAGQYKTTKQSDSKLKFKRLYKFQSHGWNTITKQLSFNDSGYFQFTNSHLSLTIDLTRQIVFWILMLLSGLFIMWKLFHVPFIISLLIIVIPTIIGWAIGLLELKEFIEQELKIIYERIKDYKVI